MEAPFPLPLDLILHVLALSDPVAIARGAATCKELRRRVITALNFRGHLLRSADRFLVGAFYRHQSREEVRVSPLISPARPPDERPPIPVASFMSRNADLFDSHRLVASSHGLLVLTTRRGEEDRFLQVCVCDPVTGNRTSFQPPAVSGTLYVLLPLKDNDRIADLSSFRLLVADEDLRTQTFSSVQGNWGAVTSDTELPVLRCRTKPVQPFPVVLSGVAYWLYRQSATTPGQYRVVALNVRTGQARSIDVPQDCLRRRLNVVFAYRELLLAQSADGSKLSLVVAETTAISVWTVPEDAVGQWVRSTLIQTATILRSVKPVLPPLACQTIRLEWFGQRSGSVIFQMHGVGLLVLNLRTKQIQQLETSSRTVEFELFCPYELDLVSLFTSKKKV